MTPISVHEGLRVMGRGHRQPPVPARMILRYGVRPPASVARRTLLLAFVCLGVAVILGARLAHAGTTTNAAPNYDYDHSATFAQSASESSVLLTGSSASAGARPDERPAPLCLGIRASVAAESETSLFRAVSSAERTDIESFRGFRQAPNGESYEGKLFATTAEDAARYGRINYGIDRKPFHIVEARVPSSLAESLYSGTADSMRYVSVGPEQLAQFNALARINIWNSVPWVATP